MAIYFTSGNVSFHVTFSIHLALSSPLPMSVSLFLLSILLLSLLPLPAAAAAAAKLLQSCPTLCDPINSSPPAVPGILQARTLEWVAISCEKGCVQAKSKSSPGEVAESAGCDV